MKFFDTSSLLLKANELASEAPFVISSITSKELENIKTNERKSPSTRYAARVVLNWFRDNQDSFTTFIYKTYMQHWIEEVYIEPNDDAKILASAVYYDRTYPEDGITFVTNDNSLYTIASKIAFTPERVEYVGNDYEDNYSGYVEKVVSEEELSEFYSNMKKNVFDVNINQYVILYDELGEYIDCCRWTEEGYKHISYANFDSPEFGNVKPYKNDIYQTIAADSLLKNQLTMIKGPAGTGKTYLALASLFARLKTKKIDKIIVFCNTVATKNSAKLGFYPGTRDEKLLDSQIGNMLSSKLGGKDGLYMLMGITDDGYRKSTPKLELLPMSDIRGFDTNGMKAGIYISEAQNLDVELMKLALQRVGEDCICIIDGDDKTQVDDVHFAGANNGMKRVSKVFRGQDFYGEVELKNIYRSKIAEIAELMTD